MKPLQALVRLALALVCLAGLTWGEPVAAEMSPKAYVEAARQAPEQMRISVIDAQVDVDRDDPLLRHVAVNAKVTEVRRTSTFRRVGDVIAIRYDVRELAPLAVGPAPLPVLVKDQDTVVLLKWASEGGQFVYAPAAFGGSFAQSLWDQLEEPEPAGMRDVAVMFTPQEWGCGGKEPSDIDVVHRELLADGRVRVSVTRYFNSRITFHTGPGAIGKKNDREAVLLHPYEVEPAEPGKPIRTCLRPVTLVFELQGLPDPQAWTFEVRGRR